MTLRSSDLDSIRNSCDVFSYKFLTWNGPHPPIYLKMSSKSLITSSSLFFMIYDAFHWWIQAQSLNLFSECMTKRSWGFQDLQIAALMFRKVSTCTFSKNLFGSSDNHTQRVLKPEYTGLVFNECTQNKRLYTGYCHFQHSYPYSSSCLEKVVWPQNILKTGVPCS